MISVLAVAAMAVALHSGPSLDQRAAEAARATLAQENLITELAGMGAIDQFLRIQFLDLRKTATPAERVALDDVWKRDYRPVDQRHVARLKTLLQGRSWFKVTEVGPAAERAAFSIVNHSNDLAFQKQVLTAMEPLLATGEAPTGYANLYDRVAVQEGRLQRYGTQKAACLNGRHAPPSDLENPAGVDQRRLALGQEPMAKYLAQLDSLYGRCDPSSP